MFTTLASMLVISMFYRVSMAVVSFDLTTDLGLSAAELGIISGVFFYVFACAQIPLGPLLDRFGGRVMVSTLGVVTAGGSLLFATAASYPSAVAGRVLLGLGTASVLMGSLKIFSNWFTPQEFIKVSGFMIAVGNLGSVGATMPLAYVIKHFGWRPTFVAVSFAQLAITLAVFLITRDTPATEEIKMTSPAATSCNQNSIFQAWKILSVSPDFWSAALIAFFWYANYMVLLGLWGGPYLTEVIRLDRSESSTILLCTSFGYICGSFSLGKVITLLGGSLNKTVFIGQTILLVTMTAMLGPAEHASRAMLAAIFFLIGLASASGVIIYPLARNLVPHRFAATAMTCVNFFLLMGAAAAQHIMGLYIHSFPRGASGYPALAYHGAFLIPICGLTGTLIIFVINKRWIRTAPFHE